MDLFLIEAYKNLDPNNQLIKLQAIINFQALGKILHEHKVRSKLGRTGFCPILLFKCLIVQHWHNLSDNELVRDLKVRIDFMYFLDLKYFDQIPDRTTIVKFRRLLIEKCIYDPLFYEVNRQLQAQNLMIKQAECAVVDATIIESSARPRKIMKVIPEDRKEDDFTFNDNIYNVNFSHDKDASWTKKRGNFYYGYKAFAVANEEGGVIGKHITPANRSETPQLERALENVNAKSVLGDQAYRSKNNNKLLEDKGFENGLMHRPFRNTPLTQDQKRFNKKISKTRYVVEQTFGILKGRFKFRKARYLDIFGVDFEFTMKCICRNMLNAIGKITISSPVAG